MSRLGPLITVDELGSELDVVEVFDIRWDLGDSTKGRATYAAGHIPGAVFVDLDTDLSRPSAGGGRHPLPPIDEFARTLGELGISPTTAVVVYDDVAGRVAARLWWMLRSIGHEDVRVLDGGYQAWVRSGRDIGVGLVEPKAATYPVPAGFRGVAAHHELDGRSIVDARSSERYRGEHEPVDPKAGHIPGAVNIATGANLDDEGYFLDPAGLAGVYDRMPGDAVVSCGSGVNACHTALAMVHAGFEMPDVYIGSFSEWSRLDLPVSTGPNP